MSRLQTRKAICERSRLIISRNSVFAQRYDVTVKLTFWDMKCHHLTFYSIKKYTWNFINIIMSDGRACCVSSQWPWPLTHKFWSVPPWVKEESYINSAFILTAVLSCCNQCRIIPAKWALQQEICAAHLDACVHELHVSAEAGNSLISAGRLRCSASSVASVIRHSAPISYPRCALLAKQKTNLAHKQVVNGGSSWDDVGLFLISKTSTYSVA